MVNVINLALALSCMHWILFSMQIMIIPYLVEQKRLSAIQFTVIQTGFALGQMFGNLWYSKLCRSNLNLALLVAFASSLVTYFLTYVANGFILLLASRISYFAAQTPLGVQTLIALNTKSGDRAKYFGQLGATIGFGFAVGSFTAGLVASWFGNQAVILLGMIVSASALPLIYLSLADQQNASSDGDKKKDDTDKNDDSSSLFKDYLRLLSTGPVLTIFVIRCLCSLSMLPLFTIFGIYIIKTYETSPIDNSLLMVYGNVFGIVANFLALPHLSKQWNEAMLLLAGFAQLALFGVGLLIICKFYQFYIIWPLFSGGVCFIISICDTQVTKMVRKTDHSLALSLGWFSESVINVLAPTVSEFLLNEIGFKAFGYAFIACAIVASTLISVFKSQILIVVEKSEDDDEKKKKD